MALNQFLRKYTRVALKVVDILGKVGQELVLVL